MPVLVSCLDLSSPHPRLMFFLHAHTTRAGLQPPIRCLGSGVKLCRGEQPAPGRSQALTQAAVPALTLPQPNYNKCPSLGTPPKLRSSLVSTTNRSVVCSNEGDVEISGIILPPILLDMGPSPVLFLGFRYVYASPATRGWSEHVLVFISSSFV